MRSKIFCIDWKTDHPHVGIATRDRRSDNSLYSVTIGAGYRFLLLVFPISHSICYR